MEIGKRIQNLRQSRGLSLRELGSRINISYSYISQIENGSKTPNLDFLNMIAKFFDVEVSLFFDKDYDSKYNYKNAITKEESDNLLEILKEKDLKWGDQELTEDQKNKAIEMMKILFDNK